MKFKPFIIACREKTKHKMKSFIKDNIYINSASKNFYYLKYNSVMCTIEALSTVWGGILGR